MDLTRNTTRTLLLTCGLAGALRTLFFFLSENAGGDALARVGLTAQWLHSPSLQLHFGPWLPVHFWLIGLASLFIGDVELAGRTLSLVLGIATVGVVAFLTKELAGVEAACLSTLVFSFYSLHIAYSVTSSSDVPYIFFTLLGLALFFHARNVAASAPLLFAAFALTCGAGIRYEAWIVIFALDLILLFGSSRKDFLYFASISAAFPVFWAVYDWRTRSNPLYAPVLNHTWVAEQLHDHPTTLTYRLLLPLVVVVITLTPLGLLGALNAARSFREKGSERVVEFSAVLLLVASVELFQIVTAGVMSFARYTLTVGTMVSVLSGVGLQQFALRRRVLAALLAVNLILISALSFSNTGFEDKVRSISPVLRFRRYVDETGAYLRARAQADDSVIFDNYNDEANVIAWESGFPLTPNNREVLIFQASGPKAQADLLSRLQLFIQAHKSVYVVYSPNGVLSSMISFPTTCSKLRLANYDFNCVFENSKYQIYRGSAQVPRHP